MIVSGEASANSVRSQQGLLIIQSLLHELQMLPEQIIQRTPRLALQSLTQKQADISDNKMGLCVRYIYIYIVVYDIYIYIYISRLEFSLK